jgi:hypothetical protein
VADELTAILFALHREAAPFRRLSGCLDRVDAPVPAWRDARGTLVVVTGMGAARSRSAFDWLIGAYKPARVISAGLCGSLVAAHRVGALIRPSAVFAEGDPPRDHAGVGLVSVGAAVLGAEARRGLHVATGAGIVDMESATVQSGCARRGIAFDCLRVVSDDPRWPLPDELSVILDGERLRFGRLLSCLARRPSLGLDLVRLARHSRAAVRLLARGLMEMLVEPVPV